MSNDTKSKIIIVPKGIASHTHTLFEPSTTYEDKEYKFCLMISKTDTKIMSEIKDEINKVKFNRWGKKIPNMKNPVIKDGDETEKEYQHGYWMLWPKQSTKVPVLNYDKTQITDKSIIYSGSSVKTVLRFSSYDYKGSCGVSCYLHGVQKIGEGEVLYTPEIDVDEYFSEVEPEQSDDDPLADVL